MDNKLIIRIMEVRAVGVDGLTRFCIFADDGRTSQKSDEMSLDEFLERYKTENDVIEEVLSWDEFTDCAFFNYDEGDGELVHETVASVEVYGMRSLTNRKLNHNSDFQIDRFM